MKQYDKINIIFLCFLLTLIPACKKENPGGAGKLDQSTASWPIFRGNTGLTGTATALPDVLDLIWTFKTESYIVSSPVIGLGSLFIGSSDGKVYALDLDDGSKKWAYDCADDIEASPLLLEEKIWDLLMLGADPLVQQ